MTMFLKRKKTETQFKFGKRPPRIDPRTFQLKTFLKVPLLPTLPKSFDVDKTLTKPIPTPMFANDKWGDCVIAGRAHQTLRFECFEEQQILSISDQEVLNEYWNEQKSWCNLINNMRPHPDNGLVMLNSLNAWRRNGWTAAGKTYDIYAYAAVDRFNQNEIKYAIYLLEGMYAGIQVPQSAVDQFNQNKIWDDAGDNYILGGHAIYVKAFDSTGLTCITWAKPQKMTWKFWLRYSDEVYGIIDNKDKWVQNSPVDVVLLDQYLHEIIGGK